jgi:hypothetical protein
VYEDEHGKGRLDKGRRDAKAPCDLQDESVRNSHERVPRDGENRPLFTHQRAILGALVGDTAVPESVVAVHDEKEVKMTHREKFGRRVQLSYRRRHNIGWGRDPPFRYQHYRLNQPTRKQRNPKEQHMNHYEENNDVTGTTGSSPECSVTCSKRGFPSTAP